LVTPANDAEGYFIDYWGAGEWRGPGFLLETSQVAGKWQIGQFTSDEIVLCGMVAYQRSGWPLQCLECGYVSSNASARSAVIAGFEAPEKIRSSTHAPGGWWNTPRFVPALPLRPLLGPFVLDSLFYSVVLFSLLAVPRVVRRYRRAWTGRCVRCGYDRSGLAADAKCPECGA
jgi:hypothetical protein